jgi:hypothetical protein
MPAQNLNWKKDRYERRIDMNGNDRISAFLLERYHIGEVNNEEKLCVEKALIQDPALAAALAGLARADQDFRQRFPRERFFPAVQNVRHFRSPLVWGLGAAALILVIALPMFVLMNSAQDTEITRIKGRGNSVELSVYLKGNSAGENVKLPDQTDIHMGNTVQLAYRIQPDVPGERYGVIFSIDGRSLVTLHYPFSAEQSTQLVSGKAVLLNEAYTLDDAPDYEIFFFVVRDKPLEVKNVLNTARQLALQMAKNPQAVLQQGNAAFKGCELQVLTLRKD